MASLSDAGQEHAVGAESASETHDKRKSLEEKKEEIQKILEEALVNARLGELTLDDCDATAAGPAPHPEPRQPQSATDVAELRNHPAPSSASTEWTDITREFTEAASQLAPGQLVQEIHFSLFDAMSAIEVMDAKMDASLQWRNFPNYPRSPGEALTKGLVKLEGHTCAELIGVVDEVFASVATWLEGHTLAQTVFTCLYLLESSSIEDLWLRAFSQAVVKVVEHMRGCIAQSGVYAMEDQQVVSLGAATTSAGDQVVGTSLREAEERTGVLLRQVMAGKPSGDVVVGTVGREDELKATLARQKFTRALFSFVTSVSKGTQQGVETASLKLSQCLGLLPEIVSTVGLGVPLDSQDPLTLGFHPIINHHLLPPSYKPYSILPREGGYRSLGVILSQLQEVLVLCKLGSFGELLEGMAEFGGEGGGGECPNILVRSFLVTLCLQSDRAKLFGSPSLNDLIRGDAQQLCNPPSLNSRSPLASSTQGEELVHLFFRRAAPPLEDILRAHCHHRARQRQRVPKCLEALGELQQEAERVDQRLQELALKLDPQRPHLSCFGTWVLYYVVRTMVDFVVLGLEYRLYSPFEYHYVFWYLEYLYGWLQTTLKSAEQILGAEGQQGGGGGGGKGKRKGAKRKREHQLTKEKERELYVVQAKRVACVGVMRSLEALMLDGRLPVPTFEFGSEELAYKYRFLPFASVMVPNYLTYQDYVRLAGVGNYQGKEVNLYEAASRHFVAARGALETIPYNDTEDLEGLLKVVKTNLVIMNLAAQGHVRVSSSTSPAAIFDFSVHRHFPIVRVT